MNAIHSPMLEKGIPHPDPLVEVEIYWPGQEEIDAGEMPSVTVCVETLIEKIMDHSLNLEDDDECYSFFEVDIFELLKEGVHTKEQVEILAEWLRGWATDLKKFARKLP